MKKELKIKNTIIELDIYKGFDSIEELEAFMSKQGVLQKHYIIVEFLSMFYAVMYENIDKEVMIGKEEYWYRDNYLMKNAKTADFNLPYEITKIQKPSGWNNSVARDLGSIDENIKVYTYRGKNWKDASDYQYANTFKILLGITFYDTFFKSKDIGVLGNYFYGVYYGGYSKELKEFEGINPFKSLVLTKDGEVKEYRFF